MANINVYDSGTGLTKIITVDLAESVVAGSQVGSKKFYITVSTTARDPSGGTIPKIYLTDGDIADDLTTAIRGAIIELFKHMMGEYLSSSSSSTEFTSDISSLSSMLSSQSESSSSRLEGTSSSGTSVSDDSSTYSTHP